jgi:hypothetical protein
MKVLILNKKDWQTPEGTGLALTGCGRADGAGPTGFPIRDGGVGYGYGDGRQCISQGQVDEDGHFIFFQGYGIGSVPGYGQGNGTGTG